MSAKPMPNTQFLTDNSHTTFPASCLRKRSKTYTKEDLEKIKSHAMLPTIEEDFQVFSRYSPIDRKIRNLGIKSIIKKDLKNLKEENKTFQDCKKTENFLGASPKNWAKNRLNSLVDGRNSDFKKEKNSEKPKKIRNGESCESKTRGLESKIMTNNEKDAKKKGKKPKYDELKTGLKGSLIDSDRKKNKPARNMSKGTLKKKSIKTTAKKAVLSANAKEELAKNYSVYIEKKVKFSDNVREDVSGNKQLYLDEGEQQNSVESPQFTENDDWLDFTDLQKVHKNSEFVEEFEQKLRTSNEKLKKGIGLKEPEGFLAGNQIKKSLQKGKGAAEVSSGIFSKLHDGCDSIGDTSKSSKKSAEKNNLL